MCQSIVERADKCELPNRPHMHADRAVDHQFGSMQIHDDFTIIGESVQFSVFLPMGGTQLVTLSREDVRRMAFVMHAV